MACTLRQVAVCGVASMWCRLWRALTMVVSVPRLRRYEPLAVATLDLFGEVLALSCPLVVRKLVLQHLPPPPAVEDAATPADGAGPDGGEPGGAGEDESKAKSRDSPMPPLCDRFFELFPDTSSLISDDSRASLRAYVADVSRRADGAHVSVEYWTKLLAQCHVDTSKIGSVGKPKEDAGPHGPFLSVRELREQCSGVLALV